MNDDGGCLANFMAVNYYPVCGEVLLLSVVGTQGKAKNGTWQEIRMPPVLDRTLCKSKYVIRND